MDKLVGRDLKDLGNAINSLFGGRKTRDGQKPRKTEPDEVVPVVMRRLLLRINLNHRQRNANPITTESDRRQRRRRSAGAVRKSGVSTKWTAVNAAIFSQFGAARLIDDGSLFFSPEGGALGLKRLVRGAASVLFVEKIAIN